MSAPFLVLDLPDEAATAALAGRVAHVLLRGDVIALAGNLGAGKTTFARALIRALSGDPALEVPSPTFTIVQTYATPRLTVAHGDLYRLGDPAELEETGLLDAANDGAVLVEWPERAGRRLPAGRLEIALDMAGTGRRAAFTGGPEWSRRLMPILG